MVKKLTKKQKSKKLEETARSIWDSLQSHFPYIYSGKDKSFHIKTIKEYAVDLKNICDLL